MRVPAFYSALRGIALADVWHDDSDCPLGKSIALADRIVGPDRIHNRCAYCAMLDSKFRFAPQAPAEPGHPTKGC